MNRVRRKMREVEILLVEALLLAGAIGIAACMLLLKAWSVWKLYKILFGPATGA